MRSTGKRPATMWSTSKGMNSFGTLSPWITPRTVRPFCKNGVSNETSVPLRALPRSTQVPAGIRQSTASRNTAGSADVSSVKRAPSPVDLPDFGNNVFTFGVIDRVGGTKVPRQSQPMRMDVDCDDRIAANDLRGHQT